MSKDPLDLPTRRTSTLVTSHGAGLPSENSRFTQQQMDVLVQGGTKVAEGVVLLAKNIVDIAHIRASSAAEVSKIQAQSEGMVKLLRAETEQLMENRKSIRTRGEAAAQVIDQVMKNIPESDAEARRQALNILPQLVHDVVASFEANASKGE